MNPIQKFIVLNLFENTPEVFGFIHKMNVIKAKNKVENLAFKYKAAKVELVELNEKSANSLSKHVYQMASIEKLDGHNLSVRIRQSKKK